MLVVIIFNNDTLESIKVIGPFRNWDKVREYLERHGYIWKCNKNDRMFSTGDNRRALVREVSSP